MSRRADPDDGRFKVGHRGGHEIQIDLFHDNLTDSKLFRWEEELRIYRHDVPGGGGAKIEVYETFPPGRTVYSVSFFIDPEDDPNGLYEGPSWRAAIDCAVEAAQLYDKSLGGGKKR